MSCQKAFYTALAVFCVVALGAADLFAQPGGNRGRGGRQAGRGGGGGMQGLLFREDVQEELGLVDEQVEELNALREDRGGGMDREQLRAELEGLSDDERRERIRDMREERESASKEKLEELLLPDQFDRLKQLYAQYNAQGGSRSLMGGPLAEALDITDEQKEEIRDTAEGLQKELNEKIAELRKEMQGKLLEVLTDEQQAQYKKMMGDEFKFDQQQGRGGFQGGPGGRGGFQGRGGQQGGRGGAQGGRGGGRQGGGGRPQGNDGGSRSDF